MAHSGCEFNLRRVPKSTLFFLVCDRVQHTAPSQPTPSEHITAKSTHRATQERSESQYKAKVVVVAVAKVAVAKAGEARAEEQ